MLKAQATYGRDNETMTLSYDEIPVRMLVEGYRTFYINAIYGKNKLLFINTEELFNILSIPCNLSASGNRISGFIDNESQVYTIDLDTRQIKIGSKIIDAQNGFLKNSDTIYLESSLYEKAFGITMTFNFRSLSLVLKTDFELPILKQQRYEKLRINLSKIKGEVIADTILKRDYHLLKMGTLDWSAGTFQTSTGRPEYRVGLGVGAELFGGETEASVDYYNQYKFDDRQLIYIWRWIDNDHSIIRQAQIGKISTQTIAFINSPIVGAVIRNTPTTIRKATGYYNISEFTQPNWDVELYINNVMVGYTKADASGLYNFKVPIVYGYTTLKFKSIGPLGEERTVERTMNVPYTVMPAKEFEYGLSGGILQDGSSSRFGRAEFNYGVNRFLTIGGGIEYLSSIIKNPSIPFLKATLHPISRLTINGEFAYGVKACGIVNYYLHKDILLEINYDKFVEGQLATRFNAPEERKIKLTIPFQVNKSTGIAKLDLTQLVYKAFKYNQGTLLVSSYYRKFSLNSTTQLNWIGNLSSYVISDLALSYRLRMGFTIRPSVQFNLCNTGLITSKLAIEKYFSRGNISISYESNRLYKEQYINLTCRYDLPFGRTNLSASQIRGLVMTSESIEGSMAFRGGNGYIYKSINPSMGKGGILICPYLDLNRNGIFDKEEHMISLKSVGIMGGRFILGKKDSILRIPDLNAFTSYLVEFQDNDLENIAWRFKNKNYRITIDPNQFKRVEIPVVSVGEVSGMVYLNKNNTLKGIRRIQVNFTEKKSQKVVAKTLSESDGYIYYIGFIPGEYTARIDSLQLRNLGMYSEPVQKEFIIKSSEQGDVVVDIDFVLQPLQLKPSRKMEKVIEPVTEIPKKELTNKLLNSGSEILKEQNKAGLDLRKNMQLVSEESNKRKDWDADNEKALIPERRQ